MTTINAPLIDGTVKRIRRTLDRRFERNPELYVSKQDAYEIKQLLHQNNFNRIKRYFETRKYSPEMLGLIILKNSWLMSQFNKYNLNVLSLIFKNCDNRMLREHMEDIIADKKQVDLGFKKLLVPIYCNCLSPTENRYVLDNKQNNRTIVECCLRNVLDSSKDADLCYRLLQNYLHKYSYIIKNNLYLLDFSSKTNSFKNTICDIILRCEVMDKEQPEQIWINALISTGKNCFDRTIIILQTLPDRDKQIRKLVNYIIGKLLATDKQNKEYYTWGLRAYYMMHTHLRYNLILCCKKILRFDSPLALRLIELYENIGLPDIRIIDRIVKEIKEGKVSDIVINTIHDLFREVDLRPKGKKMEYIINQFMKIPNHQHMYAGFLKTYGSHPSCLDFTFDMLEMGMRTYLADIILDHFRVSNVEGYEHRFLALIKRKRFKSKKIEAYLEENHFKIYTELFGRN